MDHDAIKRIIEQLEVEEAEWRALGDQVRACIAHKRAQELRDALEADRAISGEDILRESIEGYRLSRRAPQSRFRSGHAVYLCYRDRLMNADREWFLCLDLDGKGRAFRERVVSVGSLTASLVHPREVFGPAARASAAAVLLIHNHPSGDPTPSPEDREITRRLRQVGELMGIRVVDHVVVGAEGYASLAELGWP